MNLASLVKKVALKTGLRRVDVAEVLKTGLESIIEGLVEDGKVNLIRFGSFYLRQTKPRKARNPKTGESLMVEAKIVPRFKAAANFKETVKETRG